MLLRTLLPSNRYPQITDAPINYAEFLNFFRGGHTIDDNLTSTVVASTMQASMLKSAVDSGHLTKVKNMAIPNEFLLDVTLTKLGEEFIQPMFDRKFCQAAIAEAQKSVAEDNRLHPKVGVVIVKDGKIIATGYRGESGKGDHGEYCALKKLTMTDVQGSTAYTTLEPCSERKPPKKSCTDRLIEGKVARVVYGMGDKHVSVYGHPSLQEAGIAVATFPDDLMPELLSINKEWAASLRTVPIELQRNFRVHYVRCPEESTHFILADANAPGWKLPATHSMVIECRGCGEHHRVTTTKDWKTGYVSFKERDALCAYREPQSEPDDPEAVTGLVAVEERPYKDFVIEVEIYKRSDGGGYYSWPYIKYYGKNSSSAKHFTVSVSRFATQEDALNTALSEAREHIDEGFDLTQF